ncbi:MAG: SpvB/TcaC N-terminal domain-containing protein [Myxococcaceae bacterium]
MRKLLSGLFGLVALFASMAFAQGSFTHVIPIQLPAGSNGAQPDLSLVYDSGAGNGIVGMGWQLAGLSAIGRANVGNGVNYAGSDD